MPPLVLAGAEPGIDPLGAVPEVIFLVAVAAVVAIVVTGASSGIGRAIARRFVQNDGTRPVNAWLIRRGWKETT